MTIGELSVGGQKSIQGNIYHVPVDIYTTVHNLPWTLDDIQRVSVKFKYKNICPTVVVKALNYLPETSDM